MRSEDNFPNDMFEKIKRASRKPSLEGVVEIRRWSAVLLFLLYRSTREREPMGDDFSSLSQTNHPYGLCISVDLLACTLTSTNTHSDFRKKGGLEQLCCDCFPLSVVYARPIILCPSDALVKCVPLSSLQRRYRS